MDDGELWEFTVRAQTGAAGGALRDTKAVFGLQAGVAARVLQSGGTAANPWVVTNCSPRRRTVGGRRIRRHRIPPVPQSIFSSGHERVGFQQNERTQGFETVCLKGKGGKGGHSRMGETEKRANKDERMGHHVSGAKWQNKVGRM